MRAARTSRGSEPTGENEKALVSRMGVSENAQRRRLTRRTEGFVAAFSDVDRYLYPSMKSFQQVVVEGKQVREEHEPLRRPLLLRRPPGGRC